MDPRGVANLPVSKQTYRPAAILGSQQANAQADRGWIKQMLTEGGSIYGPMVNPPSRTLMGAAPDHTDAFALKGEELFFRAKATIDTMGVSRELQGHRRNVANESIHGFTNLRAVAPNAFRPGDTPVGHTKAMPAERAKTELSFVEAEKNVVPMGIIARPDSEADSGSGNTTTHLNAVLSLRNTSNVDWPAGALGCYRFPRPWELPQGADIASARTGVRPTAWVVPVDRKTFEWDQMTYMAQSLVRMAAMVNAAPLAAEELEYWTEDRALAATDANGTLFLADETDRIWYHLIVADMMRTRIIQQEGAGPDVVIRLRELMRQSVASWQAAAQAPALFTHTIQRATMALRGLLGKFDSTIICRFLKSAPKGGEAEVFMRS